MTSRVLGVLGGQFYNPQAVLTWCQAADVIIAADSGADLCIELGIKPIVIGDMDSVHSDLTGLKVIKIEDQSKTDCDKLLDWVSDNHPAADLVLAGVEGDRLDHILATLGSCARSDLPIRLLLQRGTGQIVRSNSLLSHLGLAGRRVSLMPIGPCIAGMSGVEWPFEPQPIDLTGFHSVSNVAQDSFLLEVVEGTALLIIEGHPEPW
ncbi:thiamine diphosphokinase [Kamptonema cortianum]|nr:thiamine diphosphokinase [Geitlerinema splendidum]MDK3160991.1 thiamine diphosphokinase [Kamptonema cortianum]